MRLLRAASCYLPRLPKGNVNLIIFTAHRKTTLTTNAIARTSTSTGTNSNPTMEQWRLVPGCTNNPHKLPSLYFSLSKFKLSALVVATTFAGFEMTSQAANLPLLGWTLLGVGLSSFSANTFNQWIEVPFDSQMGRTRTRPLPTHRLSTLHAFQYGILTGLTGVGVLAWNVGWLPATLSGLNILLYAGLYTPMKRTSIGNTWIGAVVGAIPPLIGHIAGHGSLTWEAACLAALLYSWQFPHFNSLSWNLRSDYSRAGYAMASVLQPALLTRVALRHSILLVPLTLALIPLGSCSSWLALDSMLVNAGMIYLAALFKANPSRDSARRLFFYALLHLPLLLALIIFHHTTPGSSSADNDGAVAARESQTSNAQV